MVRYRNVLSEGPCEEIIVSHLPMVGYRNSSRSLSTVPFDCITSSDGGVSELWGARCGGRSHCITSSDGGVSELFLQLIGNVSYCITSSDGGVSEQRRRRLAHRDDCITSSDGGVSEQWHHRERPP